MLSVCTPLCGGQSHLSRSERSLTLWETIGLHHLEEDVHHFEETADGPRCVMVFGLIV